MSVRARGAAIGGSLVAGWVLHDLLVMVTSPDPALAQRLLGGSLALVVVGTALGWLLAGVPRAVQWSLLAVVPVIAVALSVLPVAVDPAHVGLAKSLTLLVIAAAGLAVAPPRWQLAGLPLGLLLAVTAAVWRHLRWTDVIPGFLMLEALIAAVAAALLLTTQLAQRRRRRQLAAALVVVCTVAVGVRAWYCSRLPRPDLPASPAAAAGKPSLLLVVLDTVRADHLSVYGYQHPTTPGLERLLDQGFVRYNAARSTSSWTLPAHGSLLTGLLPSDHGATHVRSNEKENDKEMVELSWSWVSCLRDDVPTLAEVLDGEGYRTGAIVANSAVLSHQLGLDRGFSHYDDRGVADLQCRFSLLQQLGWRPELSCLPYRDATAITDLALSWLDGIRDEQPFFLFLNYLDAHKPYFPPQPFDDALEPRQPADPLKPSQQISSLQYDRELCYLDHELQRLLAGLRRDHRLHNTVVIITSDHGEAFGEHGHWYHAQYLYEELIRVPLLVKGVGRSAAPQPDLPISGEQVFGLALAELGLGPEPPRTDELRLVAEWYCSEELAAVCQSHDLLAWLEGNHKYLVHVDGRIEVYDLASDRQELHDLAAETPDLERAAQASREHWARPPASQTTPQLSPEMLKRLEALGYLQATEGS